MNGVTVIFEFNCYDKGGVKASVWLFPGLVLKQIGETEAALSEIPGAQKLAGPIDIQAANEYCESLKSIFQKAQIPIEYDAIADD
jgi:hypothetical protein